MSSLNNRIDTWIFDLDNTLYSADSGIFQQVHELMGKFVSNHLNIGINEAKEIQKKYYKKHGTTLRGLMDNHGVEPDYFLSEVHKLDYSIVNANKELNVQLSKLNGKKMVSISSLTEGLDQMLDQADRQANVQKVSESVRNASQMCF